MARPGLWCLHDLSLLCSVYHMGQLSIQVAPERGIHLKNIWIFLKLGGWLEYLYNHHRVRKMFPHRLGKPLLYDAVGDPLDGGDDSFESLHEKRPRAGNVDTLKSIPLGSKKASFIEKDPGLIQHEMP